MSTTQPTFGPIRSFLWPIHRSELSKLLPMLFIFFLISFNYNMLRNLKDAFIVTQKASGAEVIPFIKVWVMLPMALVMTYVFARLKNRLSTEHTFYIILSIFLGYFLIFALLLYPNQEALKLDSLSDYLTGVLPKGCKGLIAMFRYWLFTSFYVMAELWSSIVLSVLFGALLMKSHV